MFVLSLQAAQVSQIHVRKTWLMQQIVWPISRKKKSQPVLRFVIRISVTSAYWLHAVVITTLTTTVTSNQSSLVEVAWNLWGNWYPHLVFTGFRRVHHPELNVDLFSHFCTDWQMLGSSVTIASISCIWFSLKTVNCAIRKLMATLANCGCI